MVFNCFVVLTGIPDLLSLIILFNCFVVLTGIPDMLSPLRSLGITFKAVAGVTYANAANVV